MSTSAPPPDGRPSLPGPWAVVKQLYKDWFGKDVQETPTVSYVWTADQFGHFSLGFTITFLFYWVAEWVLTSYAGWSRADFPGWVPAACGAANFLIWLVKEVQDYRREVRVYDQAHRNPDGSPVPGVAQFPFNGRELWWNVITALIYFLTGIVVAVAALYLPLYGIVAVGVVFVMTLGVGYWWVRRKITFQQAGLPYLFRLANFPNSVGDAEDVIETFSTPLDLAQAGSHPPEHLIVVGPVASGKSSLAIGLGTEHAFRMGIGRYTTLAKVLEYQERRKRAKTGVVKDHPATRGGHVTDLLHQEFDDGRILWPWDRSPLLILDDVDDVFGYYTGDDAGTRERGEAVVAALEKGYPEVLAALRQVPRTVWVLTERMDPQRYADLLVRVLDAAPDRIRIVRVSVVPRQGERAAVGFMLK